MADLNSFLVTYRKDEKIFSQGDSGDEMFFIHSGKIRIEKKIGAVTHTLAILEKGDFFGEMSLLENEPRAANAIVEEDASLLRVNAEHFSTLLASNVEIAIRMIRKYIGRVRHSNQQLEEVISGQQHIQSEIENIIQTTRTSSHIKNGARLVERLSQSLFEIDSVGTLLGRSDPVTNQKPDIDLTSLDVTKSTSRRHARIYSEKGQFMLIEEMGVANGTYLNGTRLLAKRPSPLKTGDIIRLGNVEFSFELFTAT